MSKPTPLAPQRGLSLVELLIGCAVALFIVSGAITLLVDHLRDSRRLLLEARVHQDMRAAADLIARDLRRAGYWQAAQGGALNPYRTITPTGASATATVTYSFSRDATENGVLDPAESTGFRLASDTLQTLNGGSWQALTDPGTVRVTRFAVTPQIKTVPLGQFCMPACALGSTGCPALHVRSYLIELRGQSTTDPAIVREIREAVRVRNDELPVAACPGPAA